VFPRPSLRQAHLRVLVFACETVQLLDSTMVKVSDTLEYGIYDFVRNMFVNVVYKHVYMRVFNPAWGALCFQE
jgi:hypothetical protein